MFNFNHLYYFYTTARMGGVSKAAGHLNISQPSLSSQLKVLESQIGQTLFQKSGRNMILTEEGEKVYQYCQRIFSAANDLQSHLKSKDSTVISKIHVGMSEQIEHPFVADLISQVFKLQKKQRPRVEIHVGSHQEMLDALTARTLDVVLTNQPAYGAELIEIAQLNAPVGFFISRNNYNLYAKDIRKSASLHELLKKLPLGFVLPSQKLRLRHETDMYLQKTRIQKNIVLESDVLSVVVRAVVDHLGIGFFPYAYVQPELEDRQLVALGPKESYWRHNLYLYTYPQEEIHLTLKLMTEVISHY